MKTVLCKLSNTFEISFSKLAKLIESELLNDFNFVNFC